MVIASGLQRVLFGDDAVPHPHGHSREMAAGVTSPAQRLIVLPPRRARETKLMSQSLGAWSAEFWGLGGVGTMEPTQQLLTLPL